MKRILLLLLLAGFLTPAMAQSGDESTFYFRAMEHKLDDSDINMEILRDHFLGENVAKKLFLLKESYTWIEEESATNPTPKTFVDKPAIYNAVKKLERYYKKGIRKGYVKESEAREEFEKILDIAIFIRNQQTAEFEDILDNMKEEEKMVSLFTKSVELNY